MRLVAGVQFQHSQAASDHNQLDVHDLGGRHNMASEVAGVSPPKMRSAKRILGRFDKYPLIHILDTGLCQHGRQLTGVRKFCETLGQLLQYLVDVPAWHESRQLLAFLDKRCLTTQGGLHFGKLV